MKPGIYNNHCCLNSMIIKATWENHKKVNSFYICTHTLRRPFSNSGPKFANMQMKLLVEFLNFVNWTSESLQELAKNKIHGDASTHKDSNSR